MTIIEKSCRTTSTSNSGGVCINEVVTTPQEDWNDSAGGNEIPFDSVPGNGTINDADQWLELACIDFRPVRRPRRRSIPRCSSTDHRNIHRRRTESHSLSFTPALWSTAP